MVIDNNFIKNDYNISFDTTSVVLCMRDGLKIKIWCIFNIYMDFDCDSIEQAQSVYKQITFNEKDTK